ncbi:MAG: hypothetical protein AAF456_22290 [Planctomycetota bacterium]
MNNSTSEPRLQSRKGSVLRGRNNRSGTILILVLLTIVILALSAYSFNKLMMNHNESSQLFTSRMQSRYLTDSGMDYVRLYLSQSNDDIRAKGGLWHNESGWFSGVPVFVDPSRPDRIGRFTIIAPNLDTDGNLDGYRYGLVDESSKLNVNTLPYMDEWVNGGGRSLLMALPEMTEQIADAIIDWVDSDDEVREYGAESDFYAPNYACKNGPMDSIEELLLIRGVTPQLMFGVDTNRNGKVDQEELANTNLSAVDADMLLGWSTYLTLYSKESNLNADGLTRININGPDLEQLYTDLKSRFDETWSRYIINYRINGPYQPRDIDEIESSAAFFEIDFEQEPQFQFNQILDLIGGYTTAYDPDDLNDQAVIASPVQLENMPILMPAIMQNITTYEGESIPGRVNIMQAPRIVLEGIPGMTDEVLETIILRRETELNDPDFFDMNRQYETWILVENIVDLQTMRLLFPFICAGGDVYRAEIYGYFDDGVATSRAEVVVDTTVPVPRLLFWRDKSYLQSGYSLEILGLDPVQANTR